MNFNLIKMITLVLVTIMMNSGFAWANSSCTNMRNITLDNSWNSETLLNFTLLLVLNSTNFDYDKANIQFYDSSGTSLYFDNDSWNVTGNSHVWVSVPTIAASSNTNYIEMYYGCSNSMPARPTDVWSDYKAVYHLNDLIDSSANGNNLSGSGAASWNNGTIGGSYYFTNDEYISANNAGISGTNSFTMSLWTKTINGCAGGDNKFLSLGSNSPWASGGHFTLSCGWWTGSWTAYWCVYGNGAADFTSALDPTSDYGQWIMLTGVYDGTVERLYRNDVQIATNTFAMVLNDYNIQLASDQNGAEGITEAQIDEARVTSKLRSNKWINATYLSETNQLQTFGAEQSGITPTYSFTITVPGGNYSNSTATKPGNPSSMMKFNYNGSWCGNKSYVNASFYYNSNTYWQTAASPAFEYLNTGNVNATWTIALNNSLPTGLALFANDTNAIGGATKYFAFTAGTPLALTVETSSTKKLWMYANFTNWCATGNSVHYNQFNHTSGI